MRDVLTQQINQIRVLRRHGIHQPPIGYDILDLCIPIQRNAMFLRGKGLLVDDETDGERGEQFRV